MATSCKKDDNNPDGQTLYVIVPGANAQSEAQTAMIEMSDGDTIYFNGAQFEFTNTLSLDGKNNVVIMGNGRQQTNLSFAGQTAGAEALKINNANNIVMQGFTVTDAAGDAVKVRQCNGVVFRSLGTVWSGTPSGANGAYGLYPVLCQNVLIDSCYVFGASDAGIYVGQTSKVIVRNSEAEGNVAGIEIENTISADVYNNYCHGNTGGILVFDLPGLTQYGSKSRVYNNRIENNSYRNFAPAGNIVGKVPPGTGVMILSTRQVEVFNNTITNNNIMGIGVISYKALEKLGTSPPSDPNYNPYPQLIDIHDNIISRTAVLPDSLNDVATIFTLNFTPQTIPDILIDGYFDPSISDASGRICIRNNGSARFANLDVEHLFDNISYDVSVHDCNNGSLPEVVIDVP